MGVTGSQSMKDLPHHSVTGLIKRAAQINGDQEACIDAESENGASYTYKELLDSVSKLAGGLRDLGLTKGARVAILSLNSAEYLQFLFAVPWAGGIVVPLNIRLAPAELISILLDCDVEYMFVDDAFQAMIPALEGKLGKSFKGFVHCGSSKVDPPSSCITSVDRLVRKGLVCPDQSGADPLYMIAYTGGTTGKPKGVMLSHGSMLINALGNIIACGFNQKTRYLHCAPMFHLADCQFSFCITMAAGTHIFVSKFTPPGVLDAIANHGVTASVLVPVMIGFLLKMPNIGNLDLSSLENIVYGGSPMAPSLLDSTMKVFPNAKFCQGYGMTEMGPAIATLGPEDHSNKDLLSSAGRAVPFAEVKIVDQNDNEVPPGTVGELIVKGPHVMLGYWNNPEQTKKTVKNGWMHTGDGAMMNENGYIFIKDRIKDMIVSGGENVYSAEVESALADFPAAALCAVVGHPDEKFGELVTAVIQPKEGMADQCTLEKVKEHCAAKIAGYKCPRKVVVMEKIPVSGAGKILKHEIRKEFWKGHELERTYGKGDQNSNYQ